MEKVEEKWKEEFDKKFITGGISLPLGSERSEVIRISDIKSFIENLLEQERANARKEQEKADWFGVTSRKMRKSEKEAIIEQERKRMSDEAKSIAGTIGDSDVVVVALDDVLSIINK